MAKTRKLSKEELNAMRIRAMLEGIDPSTITEEALVEDEEPEINIVDEEKPKTKKRKSSKMTPVGSEKQVFTTSQHLVPELDAYRKLVQSLPLSVTYNEHDIHYKEQLWGIPERTVEYSIELVKQTKKAKDISDLMNNKSAEERAKADKGDVRYYRIVTYENVLHKISEIGYVKIQIEDGKLKGSIKVMSKLLKENNCNPDKVKRNVARIVKKALVS